VARTTRLNVPPDFATLRFFTAFDEKVIRQIGQMKNTPPGQSLRLIDGITAAFSCDMKIQLPTEWVVVFPTASASARWRTGSP